MNVSSLFDPPCLSGRYLHDVLSSGWLTTGPMCQRLKEALAKKFSWPVAQICLSSSATAAFQAIVDLLDERYGVHNFDIAITQATWPGLHQIIDRSKFMYNQKDPMVQVLTDIGGATLIDEQELPGVKVKIHDCCHSWAPMRTVEFAFASFYPTKLVPGAEGGVIFCQSADAACALDRWLYCGLEPGTAGQGSLPLVSGRKANMSDVQAALNLEALELSEDYAVGLEESFYEYTRQATNAGIPYRHQYFRPYLFQIVVPPEKVHTFRERLKYWGVPSAWNFRPAGLVTLPMYPRMSRFAQAMVLGQVERVFRELDLPKLSGPRVPIPEPERR